MTEPPKLVYFALSRSAADPASAQVIGAKAHGLLRLTELGLPVPPSFTLSTQLCATYAEADGELPAPMRASLMSALARLEAATGRRFGDERRPLLVSVRSGAAVSMPGMMATLLNVGLCERTLHGLERLSGNPRLARDCYARLIRDFLQIVRGVRAAPFDAIMQRACREHGVARAQQLDTAALDEVVQASLAIARTHDGQAFAQQPLEQLTQAIVAVLRSWHSERARQYRRLNQIDERLGTAVTVQAMVFGNSGAHSGAGVGFTRDPSTGERGLYLDFLCNGQGEDVVAGRHAVEDAGRLAQRLPAVAAELERVRATLEQAFRDMQDFEFTVEDGRLYLLQTRTGQRTAWAALRIAVDLVHEGLISPSEALERLAQVPFERLERVRVNPAAGAVPLARAVPAGLGVATGAIVLDAAHVARFTADGRPVILVRQAIEPDDIAAISAAQGVLTASGGRTSHAAVVARQLGKVCLVDCRELSLEPHGGCTIGGVALAEGEEVTLDGSSGSIYRGRVALARERPLAELAELERWRRAAAAACPTPARMSP